MNVYAVFSNNIIMGSMDNVRRIQHRTLWIFSIRLITEMREEEEASFSCSFIHTASPQQVTLHI